MYLCRMVCLELLDIPSSIVFPLHSPYLTQDVLFICMCMYKNSPAETLLVSVFQSRFLFGLNIAFQNEFCCIRTAVVEAEAIEEAFKSGRCVE